MRDVAMRENGHAQRRRHGACAAMGAGVAALAPRPHPRSLSLTAPWRGRVAPERRPCGRCSSLMYVEYTSLLAPCLRAFPGATRHQTSVDRPLMTLTELRYLVNLDKERHFARAAERSFVSQPTLSMALKKLETS